MKIEIDERKIEIDERKIEKIMRAGGATVLLVGAAVLICAAFVDPEMIAEEFATREQLTNLALFGCMFAYLLVTRETR